MGVLEPLIASRQSFLGPRANHEVDAGGQGGGVSGTGPLAISVAIGQDPVITQPPRIIPESSASQPFSRLVREYHAPIPSSRNHTCALQ